MNSIKNQFSSIEQMTNRYLPNSSLPARESSGEQVKFQEILSGKQKELKFSKHANDRLSSRNIDLSAEQLERLENGTNKARQKGIRESLVMIDDIAFVVNVKNNVVVTAMGNTEDTVFTNIDGAVFS